MVGVSSSPPGAHSPGMIRNLLICSTLESFPLASEIPEEIVKVSVYLHEGVEKYADRFVPRWQQANCAVAGPYWIDTTTANKGVGVESLCRVLGFAHDEVMAFGDNANDVPMFAYAGHPVVMARAEACARRAAKYVAPDCDLGGVGKMIEELVLA